MDYCDIEWFALETNRDHSVVFKIASKYCILDSFVDSDGYSISSEGFLLIVTFLPRSQCLLISWLQSPSAVILEPPKIRDHSVIFEIVSKYCISDSFVDYEGYSISSTCLLPTVVDIMVI